MGYALWVMGYALCVMASPLDFVAKRRSPSSEDVHITIHRSIGFVDTEPLVHRRLSHPSDLESHGLFHLNNQPSRSDVFAAVAV